MTALTAVAAPPASRVVRISQTALDLGDLAQPAGQAYRILRTGFTVAPILFGLDKFANLTTDWTQYLAPFLPDLLGLSKQTFMYGVGVVEILAGVLVALKPRYAAYVVAAWLLGIILNLLILGQYLDVALRDFGLLLGALALGRLAEAQAAQSAHSTARSAAAPTAAHR